jgi:hypothetical protein
MRGLLSAPDPVTETPARLVAGGVAIFAALTVAFQQGRVFPVLGCGFAARGLASTG